MEQPNKAICPVKQNRIDHRTPCLLTCSPAMFCSGRKNNVKATCSVKHKNMFQVSTVRLVMARWRVKGAMGGGGSSWPLEREKKKREAQQLPLGRRPTVRHDPCFGPFRWFGGSRRKEEKPAAGPNQSTPFADLLCWFGLTCSSSQHRTLAVFISVKWW